MPKKVSKGSDYVEYIYLANGEKLAKKKNGQFVNFYCGSFVYKGDKSLEYIVHGEGLAQKNGSLFDYQYSLTDHLGNVRNVLNAGGTSIQSNDYYPFGLTHSAPTNFTKNKYLYNGKEAQDETIGGTIYNVLDYHARSYDPVIGRMHEPDPMQEKYFDFSSYVYCFNNPQRFIDPSGMSPDSPYEGEYDEEKNMFWSSIHKKWVSEDFYQFLQNVGYHNFGDNYAATMDAFIRRNYHDNERDDELWEQPMGTPPDLLAERGMRLAYAVGDIISYIPLVGGIYKHTSSQIHGMESNLVINLGKDALELTFLRALKFIKPLRGAGGKLNGFTISSGKGYGAKQRFDVHPLKHPSKPGRTLTIPNFLKRKDGSSISLPHYHRGKGNNLKYHRPWEKGSDGKRRW